MVALSINLWGVLARNRGDNERARACYEESLALFRALEDNAHVALVLNNLARVARDLENWERATALCAESLALFQELGDRQGLTWVLSNLAILAQRRGAWEQSARRLLTLAKLKFPENCFWEPVPAMFVNMTRMFPKEPLLLSFARQKACANLPLISIFSRERIN